MFPEAIADLSALQFIGLFGATTYVTNYVMITLRMITSESPAYYVMNLVAASMVALSLIDAFNPATLVIQAFFILVSAIGLLLRLRPAARARRGVMDLPPARLKPLG